MYQRNLLEQQFLERTKKKEGDFVPLLNNEYEEVEPWRWAFGPTWGKTIILMMVVIIIIYLEEPIWKTSFFPHRAVSHIHSLNMGLFSRLDSRSVPLCLKWPTLSPACRWKQRVISKHNLHKEVTLYVHLVFSSFS